MGPFEAKMAVRDWSKTYKDMDGDISDPKNNENIDDMPPLLCTTQGSMGEPFTRRTAI